MVVEPTSARSTPKNILVGRVVTPMWGDRWVPLKVLNPTHKPLTLRRNAKVADVFLCVAMEDFAFNQRKSKLSCNHSTISTDLSSHTVNPAELLKNCGLTDIDIESCEFSDEFKGRLAELVVTYQDVFSRGKLDCGEVKDLFIVFT